MLRHHRGLFLKGTKFLDVGWNGNSHSLEEQKHAKHFSPSGNAPIEQLEHPYISALFCITVTVLSVDLRGIVSNIFISES